ncbi:MAG TPA: hypothetical protein VN817_11620 [Solirubrobacteraceae bacterium]|nr:hypothetical protein [Solirubrobacteraceae bacterium]
MKAVKLGAGFAALVLLASGCGGGAKTPTVAHLGSSTSSSSASASPGNSSDSPSSSASPGGQAVAYSECMRAHGVPNFPEPKISNNGNEHKVAVRVTPAITGNPHFNSAQQACAKLAPGGGPGEGANRPISPQEQTQYLKAAACIRTHGVPNFPDPTFSGGGVHLPKTAGVNPHSPQVRAAEEACQSLIPGGLHGDR